MNHDQARTDDIINIRPKQEVLFNLSSLIGILIFSYYGIYHWHEERMQAALLNAIYAGLGLFVLLWVKFSRKIDIAQNLVLAMLIPFFCLILIEGGPRTEGPIWVTIYPILAFFYKGKRNGIRWLGAFILGLLAVVGLQALGAIRTPFPATGFMILIACLLTVAMYVYAYDAIRSEAEQALKNHTLSLDVANQKLTMEIRQRQNAQQEVLHRTYQLSKLNDELSTTVEKLARLNAEKSEMVNMIAHDLRNPLTGMLLTVRQLEQQAHLETPANRGRLAEIKQSIQYSKRLINNFLGLKAIEAGRIAMDMQPHDFSAITQEILSTYRERAVDKNIELVCKMEKSYALCDRSASREVIENLLSNAIKFSPPYSRIIVSVKLKLGKVLFKVRDQGPGLSEDDKRRMFKMFSRLSARPTAGEESIGLGLSTARKLAEMMSARLGCMSKHGHGATFYVVFPLAAVGAVLEPKAAQQTKIGNSPKQTFGATA